jgi:fluoride exporter
MLSESLPVLILAVGAGGMLGAWARFELAGRVYARTGADFPWGTLAVNVAASFLLGVLLPLLAAVEVPTPVRAFAMVGCIGGFSTFSTFAYEAVMLVEGGEHGRALAYTVGSVAAGLVAVLTGLHAGQAFF